MATSEMTTIGTASGVRAVFSAAEVRSFIKDGFVIARQFFSPEDVELISSEVTRCIGTIWNCPGVSSAWLRTMQPIRCRPTLA
ncbi:MAG: hypothetical protein EBQ56_09015 [Proteobacteria bacterium]|nr:hypothetical protein [Pseudomonadota bacterium]